MSTITCSHLNKSYGAVPVIKDFNLTIADHEFIVLLGPSGCGKSTLLRMLAGLENISGGELHIDGLLANEAEPRERGVAMVFQNYALYPHMSIFDNIAFGLRRLHVSKDDIASRVKAVADTLGLGVYLDRKPTALSGGQQQRVAIARAMIKTPKVFLFDEPLSNLDAKLRNYMRVEIARLHQSLKTTTVYVTHDQLEAMTLADRIVLMRDGNIEQIGTPEQIFQNPQSLFVAGFIGTPNMNLIDATVQKLPDGWALRIGDAVLPIGGQRFRLQDGQKVVLGIRPTDLTQADGDLAFTGIADMVEFHGHDLFVTLKYRGCDLGAMLPSSSDVKRGNTVRLSALPGSIHLFDKTTEQTLMV